MNSKQSDAVTGTGSGFSRKLSELGSRLGFGVQGLGRVHAPAAGQKWAFRVRLMKILGVDGFPGRVSSWSALRRSQRSPDGVQKIPEGVRRRFQRVRKRLKAASKGSKTIAGCSFLSEGGADGVPNDFEGVCMWFRIVRKSCWIQFLRISRPSLQSVFQPEYPCDSGSGSANPKVVNDVK